MNHNFYSNFVMLTQGGLQIAWKYTTSTLLVHEKSLSRLAARQQLSRASCWTSADRNVRNIICLSLSCLADCGHSRPGRTEIRQIYQILVFCTFWYSESKDTKHLIWKKSQNWPHFVLVRNPWLTTPQFLNATLLKPLWFNWKVMDFSYFTNIHNSVCLVDCL